MAILRLVNYVTPKLRRGGGLMLFVSMVNLLEQDLVLMQLPITLNNNTMCVVLIHNDSYNQISTVYPFNPQWSKENFSLPGSMVWRSWQVICFWVQSFSDYKFSQTTYIYFLYVRLGELRRGPSSLPGLSFAPQSIQCLSKKFSSLTCVSGW